MASDPNPDPTEVFTEHRELLFAIVYGMLGTVADTEDVLQETWLSWEHRASGAPIDHPRAYLVRVAVNAALARQRDVRRRRETYIGPWLPEPLHTPDDESEPDVADSVLRSESISMAMMIVLESLSPTERAVFVLNEVFGYAHTEIAEMLDRSPAAVRQLAHRARSHVQSRRPRYEVDPGLHREVTARFMTAVRGGDMDGLLDLLSPEVALTCDGGGRAPAAGPRPMRDPERIADFVLRRFRLHGRELEFGLKAVNGAPAALLLRGDEILSVLVLDLAADGEHVRDVYVVTNPDKLTHLS